ncbi:AAA-like domain-containing protein [Alkalinema sp. FACHB-956]|uniref:AAA-like domain-containing protein n=1 Tax=Alkalinema sp. FACHB-956 TaxID=2692768 RepID=UPI0018F02B30|nr:AAA-like domain-containing protein [Alkalinema sp. FACHB-956]
MSQSNQPAKRKRGILLSAKGWQRLQSAEMRLSQQDNAGKPYTLQDLSDRTGLSSNTLARVRGRKVPVDHQTLDCYFRAFELVLNPDDYTDSESTITAQRPLLPPNGQLAVDSPFYIARSPAEGLCYEAILQPGGLVRLKAPRQMGKTSLVARTLMQARENQFATVMLNLRLADASIFRDLSRFLQWFCAVVTRDLELPNRLGECWDDLFGASYNCTHYFETYLLPALDRPLVLALDEIDAVFEYPEVASDFFGILRAWYEKARYGDDRSELWQKLRLILIHSTEVYVPLSIAQSPFNAGLMVDLPGLTESQVQDLAQRYHLANAADVARQVLKLVGANTHLAHLAIYYLSTERVSLEQLTLSALAPDGIYSSYLRQQLSELQQYPELLAAFRQVVLSETPISLEPILAFKLQSKGLIQVQSHRIVPSCELYQQYFSQVFQSL